MNFNFSFHILSNCWHIQFISHHHIYCHIKFHPSLNQLKHLFQIHNDSNFFRNGTNTKFPYLTKTIDYLTICYLTRYSTKLLRFEEVINTLLKQLFWQLSIENASLRCMYAMRKIGFNDCQYKMIAFINYLSISISIVGYLIWNVLSIYWEWSVTILYSNHVQIKIKSLLVRVWIATAAYFKDSVHRKKKRVPIKIKPCTLQKSFKGKKLKSPSIVFYISFIIILFFASNFQVFDLIEIPKIAYVHWILITFFD